MPCGCVGGLCRQIDNALPQVMGWLTAGLCLACSVARDCALLPCRLHSFQQPLPQQQHVLLQRLTSCLVQGADWERLGQLNRELQAYEFTSESLYA